MSAGGQSYMTADLYSCNGGNMYSPSCSNYQISIQLVLYSVVYTTTYWMPRLYAAEFMNLQCSNIIIFIISFQIITTTSVWEEYVQDVQTNTQIITTTSVLEKYVQDVQTNTLHH